MTNILKKIMPWLLYPLLMSFVFILHALLQSNGVSLLISTYVPVLLAAACISWLEFKLPYANTWRPDFNEVKVDLTFITIVQLALPPLTAFTFGYLLLEPARNLNLPLAQLWPHTWPIWGQLLLMLLMAEFFRYWLHRAAHTNPYLWRLHSVHHSVERLYWLNTARFHPLEKILQMSMDNLPFLLMAINEQVLALYYLAYATNGFLQHSNIQLRFGILNYIISTAELHRWHHSQQPKESNNNYGNNLIIWDLVFSTWFLPKDRQVGILGLLQARYPKTFIGQMLAPFKSRHHE